MKLNDTQTIFMLFFAIFWGGVFNVQAGWKAFQWPLVHFSCRPKKPKKGETDPQTEERENHNAKAVVWERVRNRVLLSFGMLNVLPLIFFGVALGALANQTAASSTCVTILKLTGYGVVPAFAAFGFYRIWLGLLECKPDCFYVKCKADLPEEYKNSEPTTAERWYPIPKGEKLKLTTAGRNLGWGFTYVGVAAVALALACWDPPFPWG
jgi:hypothetical protein